jgi:hypothetical protein
MRWHILRTLIGKEILRLAADRGIILLGIVLVCMALLLSIFGKRGPDGLGLPLGEGKCIVDYWEESPWIEHLRRKVPEEWRRDKRLEVRHASQAMYINGRMVYPQGHAAIQIRPLPPAENGPRYLLWFWYPAGDPGSLAPFEAWFWKESSAYTDAQLMAALDRTDPSLRASMPFLYVQEKRTPLEGGGMDLRGGIATGLVIFSLFFTCVYLLPSMTCEEHERGVLLAQMLSPASAAELLTAKFFTYPILGVGLAALLAGLYRPAVLADRFFWLALLVTAIGSVGIGLSIASLARTQRLASMGALCYLLVLALFMVIVFLNNIPFVSWLVLEYYEARMLHAALTGHIYWFHWLNLIGATVLSMLWAAVAIYLFRLRGWQ